MYKILTNNEFEKDVKTCKKRGYNMKLLLTVIELLQKMVNYQPNISNTN